MAAGGDEPMPDAPAPKPRRRFAPQLVEETVKTSSSSKKAEPAQGSDATTGTNGDSLPPHTTTKRPESVPRTRTTKDASVQVDDIEMPDAPPPAKKPARRFAPVPIETTFNSNREKTNPHGPTAELTPDPSPTTPQPPSIFVENQQDQQQQQRQVEKTEKKPKRRFAPQLIETSRRARKSGQEGPATKPTDKTDITPGTNHIYAAKPKRKPAGNAGTSGPRPSTSGAVVVAESEDDDASGASPRFLTPRRQQSMKPHPNTRRGTKNSFTPDLDTILSSESGSSSEENEDDAPSKPPPMSLGVPALPDSRTPSGDLWNGMRHELRERRESCDEEISGYLLAVAAKEAYRQRQIEQVMSAFPNGLPPAGVEHFIGRDNSEDEAESLDGSLQHGGPQLARRKSTEPGWAVKEMRAHHEKLADLRNRRMSLDMEVDENDIPPPENPLWTTDGGRRRGSNVAASSPALRARTVSRSPARGRGLDASPRPQPDGGFRQGASPFGLPFGFRAKAQAAEEDDDEDALLRKMRQAASPPMLGDNLVFRKCVSPQATRMEPTHPYSERGADDNNRDLTGATGLWGGYCTAKSTKKKTNGLWGGYCTAKANDKVAAAMLWPPAFLATPAEPATPGDLSTGSMYTPPTRQESSGSSSGPQQKGPSLHHLLSASLEERLKKEKARKELEERIHREFDDAFVTQVYNYISLGYPATARAFDDELSKISGIEIEQLRKDDHLSIGKGFMLEMELSVHDGNGTKGASGKNSIDVGGGGGGSGSGSGSGSGDDDDQVMLTPEESERRDEQRRRRNKPPRWRALKLYIREWARQHPCFEEGFGEEENPMAWGVRARRGSWAI